MDSCVHEQKFAKSLGAFTKTSRAELALMQKIQNFCFDNMAYLKFFSRFITLLYNNEVIGEDTVLKWAKDGHTPKGQAVFIEQMQEMIKWLQNAEEESSDEEDEDGEGENDEDEEDGSEGAAAGAAAGAGGSSNK
jgi:Ran GTPase-activating protein (RanGAP) involved in mRNA processing and transport